MSFLSFSPNTSCICYWKIPTLWWSVECGMWSVGAAWRDSSVGGRKGRAAEPTAAREHDPNWMYRMPLLCWTLVLAAAAGEWWGWWYNVLHHHYHHIITTSPRRLVTLKSLPSHSSFLHHVCCFPSIAQGSGGGQAQAPGLGGWCAMLLRSVVVSSDSPYFDSFMTPWDTKCVLMDKCVEGKRGVGGEGAQQLCVWPAWCPASSLHRAVGWRVRCCPRRGHGGCPT